jgi:2-polyprenyl-6-methoxyphenol hydroxylase-like FAD-dependent oxidoreductase
VFESVERIEPLGVGINTLPHAVRELTELGLADRLAAVAIETAEQAYFSKHGKPVWSEPRGRAAGYNWPQFSVHRGTLQMLLLAAVYERLGADAVLTGHHLAGWDETASGVRVRFVDRASGDSRGVHDGALLIGADGFHSVARATFYPNEGPPIWTGVVLWRGITRGKPFLTGRTVALAGHEAQKFICYPISRAALDRGEAELNWIAELKFRPDHQWRREDWNRPGRREEFLPRFADWRFDWLDVPTVISATDYCYEYPMVDRDPLPRWTHGRVTLLGDAAHPMYPIGSNGASQAILDARVLARELRTRGATVAALEAYEAERRPATTAIVAANRGNGPDQVLELVEQRAPDGFARVEDVLSRAELADTAAAYRRVAGFDKDVLNERPSILPM